MDCPRVFAVALPTGHAPPLSAASRLGALLVKVVRACVSRLHLHWPFLLAALMWLWPTRCLSEDSRRYALAGASPIKVVVSLEQDAQFGVTSAAIETYVELRVRRDCGVIITKDNALTEAYLFVKASLFELKRGAQGELEGVVYFVRIEASQLVQLKRNPKSLLLGTTWNGLAQYGICQPSALYETMKSALDPQLDAFCNDYLAANTARPVVPKTPKMTPRSSRAP